MDTALPQSADLGPLVSTHRARFSIIIMARLAGGASLVGLAVLISYPLSLIDRIWLLIVAGYFLGSFAGLLLIYSLFPILSAVLCWNQKIYLHSDGIVYRRWFRRVAYRWDEIERVYRRNLDSTIPRRPTIYLPHAYVSHVLLRAISSCMMEFDFDVPGRRLTIDSSVSGFDQLWPVIEEQVTQRLLPKAIEAYQKGETLDFGRVQVSRDGISAWGAPPIAWPDVEYARIDDSVRVRPKETPPRRWINTSVGKIANVLLLVRILQNIGVCAFEDRLKRCP